MKARDIAFPVCMILLSMASLVFIGQFEEPMFRDASVDAKFFPKVVTIGIMILSLLLIMQNRVADKSKNKATEVTPIFTKLSLFGVLYLIGYALLIHFIGYLWASVLAFTLYLLLFKVRKPIYYLYAWVFVFALYYLFGEVFYIAFPQGIFY